MAHIAFTGGPDTARHIVRASAENLAKTSLELGGKSPFIVFEDADLESAANVQVSGIFAATGQSCVAGSRLLVEASVHDEFVSMLAENTSKMVLAFTHKEWIKLYQLLEESRFMLHANELIDHG